MTYLFEKIENAIDITGISKEVPRYIVNGLSSNIRLRGYQKKAIEYFLIYAEGTMSKNKQIWNLFHMATGSGKTVIMASLILYYYKQGYRNFIFLVRNLNILDKTIDNLVNQSSNKFLFAKPLEIEGKAISINRVDNFQSTTSDAINICFSSNAGLQNSLGVVPSENKLSRNDFEDNKIVIIADESHHLNASTRNGTPLFEDDEDRSWEGTVMSAFHANKDNILLEFTATCDLKNPYVQQKYSDIIVFDYPLSKFREEKYSKDIISLPSADDLMRRTLIALILSQYRYKLFYEHNLNIKPILLLKSKSINESKAFYSTYMNFLMNSLNVSVLEDIRDNNHTTKILGQAFGYFEHQRLTLQNVVDEIKLDFSEEHCVLLNSKSGNITSEDALLLNSLEDLNNPYRVIFVVDMLNEGWDVLNLFDIVRLYDTRDGKWKRDGTYTPGKTTISEQQLIGRGARYYPFKIEDWHDANKRKFDNLLDNPLRICETLIYHCTTDNRYITELRATLREVGLVSQIEPFKIELKVKEAFKSEQFYNKGFIFTNKRIEKNRSEVKELPEKLRTVPIEHSITISSSSVVDLFDTKVIQTDKKRQVKLKVKELPLNVLFKGIRQFPILLFDKLLMKYPNLKTMSEFILSKDYLGEMEILINYPNDYNYNNIDLLDAYKKLLNEVATFISKIEIQFVGSQEFYAEATRKYVKDVVTYREIQANATHGEGVSQNIDFQYQLDLSDKNWYVYNDNFGTSEEKSFVKYFAGSIDKFRLRYSKIYLIRNERQLGIYSFRSGERFEPDYLLILGNYEENKETVFYQVFIEPKGNHLLDKDKWKQEFLQEITERNFEYSTFVDNTKYKIWGLPFYNEQNTLIEFNNEIKKLIL